MKIIAWFEFDLFRTNTKRNLQKSHNQCHKLRRIHSKNNNTINNITINKNTENSKNKNMAMRMKANMMDTKRK